MEWAIQVIEECTTASEAYSIGRALMEQIGYRSGRILRPSPPTKPLWLVQAIIESNGHAPNGWLPDGCKHVLITPCMLKWQMR